ncbi:MAG TPA: PQQ-binding-like beta-propeller repeat protein [Kofleriaceae bacterium]
MRSSLLLLVLAACGQPDTQVASAATAPAAPPKPDPIAKGVPHGGRISKVAVTEQADAALTFDNTGGVRLWPALDASRTPVPVSIIAPEQLALSHAGSDLLATILDEAGSVRLMRLGRDGSVRSDVQLPSDVAYNQVIALDEGALARSEDQTIEWFSPDGTSRGRLVADPASRIQTISARHNRAVAIVTDGTSYELRWLLTMGGTLTWGARVKLPMAVNGTLFALSPSHRRFAIVTKESKLAVYELGLVPTEIGTSVFTSDPSDLGFIDEDHVAAMGNGMQWWVMTPKPNPDPWAVAQRAMPQPSTMQLADGGAVADGIAVMGFGAALSIVNERAVQYLGYKEHGVGNVGAAPSSLWVSMSGSHIVWLDDKLAVKREVELRKDQNSPWVYATPIGDHHVITQVQADNKYKVELVDLDNQEHPVTLGTFPNVERIDYAPESNLLGISVFAKIQRYKLDLEHDTASELAPVKIRGSMMSMRLFDAAKADGITAITIGWAHEYDEDYTLTMYRDKGGSKKMRPFSGRVIDINERGDVFIVRGNEIETHHAGKKISSFKLDSIGTPVAVTADGSRFAVLMGSDVVVVDNKGAEQWRKPVWGTAQLLFTKNGKQLAVRANGGLVMLDAATGERHAMECAWSFSLSTIPPATNALASAPVCEDPML